MAWLARALQPQEFALFGAALNAGLVALAVMEGGWSSLLYRELAGVHASRYAAQLPAAALTHAALAFIPCVLVLALLLPSGLIAVSVALCMLAVALMNQYSARLRAAGRFTREALWQVSGRVCSAAAIVMALLFFADIASGWLRPAAMVFVAWLIGLGVCLSLAASQWWRAPDWQAARSLYPMAAALLLTELSVTVIGKGDLIVLSFAEPWIATRDALPGYAASVRLVEGVLLLTAPFANVVIAYVRGAAADRVALVRRQVLLGALALWLSGCLLWLTGWAYGAAIIRFIFGATYAQSPSWLVWAALPLPWMMANLVLLQAAIGTVKLASIMVRVALCAAFFLAACVVLLRLMGPAGVGVSAALSQALLSFVLLRCFLRAGKGGNRVEAMPS